MVGLNGAGENAWFNWDVGFHFFIFSNSVVEKRNDGLRWISTVFNRSTQPTLLPSMALVGGGSLWDLYRGH